LERSKRIRLQLLVIRKVYEAERARVHGLPLDVAAAHLEPVLERCVAMFRRIESDMDGVHRNDPKVAGDLAETRALLLPPAD
jgi:hypothetical protein